MQIFRRVAYVTGYRFELRHRLADIGSRNLCTSYRCSGIDQYHACARTSRASCPSTSDLIRALLLASPPIQPSFHPLKPGIDTVRGYEKGDDAQITMCPILDVT